MPRKKLIKYEDKIEKKEPIAGYKWIRIEVYDLSSGRPPKKVKKYRPAWNVLNGFSL